MFNHFFTFEFWLTQAAVSAPVWLMLVVGMVICYRQRRRRPRVAKLIGWALFAELIWITFGTPLFWLAFSLSGLDPMKFFAVGNAGEVSWMLRMIVVRLPISMVSAAIWGTVLWAVLQVDDWRDESASS